MQKLLIIFTGIESKILKVQKINSLQLYELLLTVFFIIFTNSK